MQNKFENEVVANQVQVYLFKSYKEKYDKKTKELETENQKQTNIIADLEKQLNNIVNDDIESATIRDKELQKKIGNLYHIDNPPEPYILQFDNWEAYYRMVFKDIIEIKDKIKKDHKEKLIDECKSTILNTVAITFGVDKLLIQDKDGGNVDTIHNVRNKKYGKEVERQVYDKKTKKMITVKERIGVYSSNKEETNFISREEYDSTAYHSHQNYKDSNKKYKEMKENGQLHESTSGKKFNQNEKHDQDHTISGKEISDDPAVILAELYGPDLANVQSNLVAMYPSINRSKKAKTMDEYIEYWHKTQEKRQSQIKDLESKKDLSDKERKKLKSLKDIESFDEEKAREQDRKAREEYNKTLNKEYYLKNPKFAKNLLKTSAKQAGLMGLREIFAIIFKDIVSDLFNKAKELHKNNIPIFSKEGMTAFKDQLKVTFGKLMDKWDEILKNSFNVAISGFISNIITTIINIFATTLKKWVKVIREGTMSLFKAFKLILSNSDDMTKEEKYHEASKIVIATLSVALGVIIDEALEKFFTAHQIPFSDIISSVISGIVTGLTSVSLVYAIDKIDFFGVNSNKELEAVFTGLEDISFGLVE